MSNVEPIEPNKRGNPRKPQRRGDARVPPHNIAAEESLLGSLLLSRDALADVIDVVAVSDFYKIGHQYIYEAIRALHSLAKPVDVVTVSEELRRTGLLDEAGGIEALAALQNATPAISHALRYAEAVVRTAQQRAIIGVAAELADGAFEERSVDDSIAEGRAALELITVRGGERVVGQSGHVFMERPPETYDWLQPFILERLDRLLVTGGEGSGKSLLLLQWAVMAAAGVHWWLRTPVPSCRVAFIDLEIGHRRTRRRIELFADAADEMSSTWRDNLYVYSKPGDVDLSTRAGASFLASLLEAAQPDMLILGPIYRLTSGVARPGDLGGEDAAKRAAFALDKIIERYNVALVSETHAAKGDVGRGRDLRPFGSSVWTRWPDFGYGILRQAADNQVYHEDNREWTHWRGDRDPRSWPTYFRQSTQPGDWRMQAEFEVAPSWVNEVLKGTPINTKRIKPPLGMDEIQRGLGAPTAEEF